MASSTALECPICFLSYDREMRVPKVLNCGHTFCSACLGQLICRHQVCPECRRKINLPGKGIVGLPTNFLAYSYDADPSVRSNTCEHGTVGSCKECQSSVIQQTAVSDTNTAMRDLQQTLDDLNSVTTSKHHPQSIRKQMRDIRSRITSLCDSYSLAVDKLKKNLTDKAEDGEKEHLRDYKTWQKSSYLKKAEAQAFLHICETDMEESVVTSIGNDALQEMQEECTLFRNKIKTLTASLAEIKEYRLCTSIDVVSNILGSAKIVLNPDRQDYSVNGTLSRMTSAAGDICIDSRPSSNINSEDTTDKTESATSGSTANHSQTLGHTIPQNPNIYRSLYPRYSQAQLVKEVGRKGMFAVPRGIACMSIDRVIIVDQVLSIVQIFDSNMDVLLCSKEFPKTVGLTCVAVDSKGRIFISEHTAHNIQVMDENCELLYTFGSFGSESGFYKTPAGIAIDQRDRVYICDQGNGRVQVVTTDGVPLSILTEKGSGRGKLGSQPRFVSVDNENSVIISEVDGDLHIFDDSGNFEKLVSRGQPGSFCCAGATVRDHLGNLLVADIEAGCVVVLDTRDQVICKISDKGNQLGQMRRPWGLAFNSKGHMFVTDKRNCKVLEYNIPQTTS